VERFRVFRNVGLFARSVGQVISGYESWPLTTAPKPLPTNPSRTNEVMNHKYGSLKRMTYTFGEVNADLFLKAGWTLIQTETTDHFTKFIFGWTEERDPPYPEGITNPLKQWVDLIDSEIEKERAKLLKKS
jgi:hypothetical protein